MAYQGSSGAGGYEEDHRLHDLPPGGVSIASPYLQSSADAVYSNIIYLPMKALMRKMNEPSYPTARAPLMGHSMSHTLGPQLPQSDLRQTTLSQSHMLGIIDHKRLLTTDTLLMATVRPLMTPQLHLAFLGERHLHMKEVIPAQRRRGSRGKHLERMA